MSKHIPIKDTTKEVIAFWRERGFNVGEGGEKLIGGIPASIKKVTPRKANGKLFGRVSLEKLTERKTMIKKRETSQLSNGMETFTFKFRRIMKEVCDKHECTLEELKSENDRKKLAKARFEAYFLLSTELNMSSPRIGKIMNRHHSTVLHGIKRHKKLKDLK